MFSVSTIVVEQVCSWEDVGSVDWHISDGDVRGLSLDALGDISMVLKQG